MTRIPQFQVLLADPPWEYQDKGSRVSPDHPDCKRGYTSMSNADICKLPMRRLVADDSLLFLWTTSTHLLDLQQGRTPPAHMVARAWGFRPTVIVPWVKISESSTKSKAAYRDNPAVARLYDAGIKLMPGNGHYTFSTAEFMLICTRGRARDLIQARLPNLIVAPRGAHSEKPDEQFDFIHGLVGEGRPSIELFCRGAGRDPYWVWGLESEGDRRVMLPGIGRWFGDAEHEGR